MKPELNSLKAGIQKLLASPGYAPLRVSEIIAALKIPANERGKVRRILDGLVNEGSILRVRKDRLALPSRLKSVIGRLQMHEKGFGFVVPNPPSQGDNPLPHIFIAAGDTSTAMHGDTVEVKLQADRQPSRRQDKRNRFALHSKKSEGLRGRIVRVILRAHPTLIGTLHRGIHAHFVTPDEPRIGHRIHIHLSGNPLRAKTGDRVVVKLLPWIHRNLPPEGILQEVLGRADDPRLDLHVIIKKFKFRTDFPDDVLAQVETIPEAISGAERVRRMDFTQEVIVTIDPDDARDHDDALSLHRLPHGNWRLGVHIADVSHYVRPGSALDREARERGNSIYLPDHVIPMLPPPPFQWHLLA